MSGAIYQLVIIKNNPAVSMARKALPEPERSRMEEKENASRIALGVSQVLMCSSAWADEERPWWGVLRFPSLEARIQHTRTLQEIGWMDYVDAFTLLGTAAFEPAAVTLPNPVYQLWLLRSNPAGSQYVAGLPKGLNALRWEKHDAIHKENNSHMLMFCKSNWCNEAYTGFGISVYPDIDACMRIRDVLVDLGWPGYMECNSLLGIAV